MLIHSTGPLTQLYVTTNIQVRGDLELLCYASMIRHLYITTQAPTKSPYHSAAPPIHTSLRETPSTVTASTHRQ